MSSLVAQHVHHRRRQPHRRLNQLRALGALVLLVVFVLAGGHRVFEGRDEGE